MVILAQDGLGIKRARSGNWGASLGSLLPLLSSAKEHSQTGPPGPGPRMWHVQSDTWTSQWCTYYHTSLLQKRAAFPPQAFHSFIVTKLKRSPSIETTRLWHQFGAAPGRLRGFFRVDITTRPLVLTSGASGVTGELSCSTQGVVYPRHAGLGRALAVRQHIRQGHS